MRSLPSILISVSVSFTLTAGTAAAEPPPPTELTATSASAEVKAAKGVSNHEPIGEGTRFGAGELVWVWSRISGADGTTVQHVWKKDGKEVWTASLPIRSVRWTTSSRRVVQPGQYQVEVRGQEGAALGVVSFSVE